MPSNSQRGFTLIELMVSLVIGLIIMIALIAVFLNVSRTNTEMAKTNGMIESGRFSIDVLQEDIEHAGFWGGYVPLWDDISSSAVPDDTPTIVPDPCLAYANWAATAGHVKSLIGIAIQTYSGVPPGCSALVADRKANTDVVVVRRAEVCLPGVGNCEAYNASKIYFQGSRCATEITAGNRYVLSTDAGTSTFVLTNRDCTTVADKRKFVSDIYYVRTWSVTSGDGIPTLVRSTFNLVSGLPAHETPQALIEGVEGFVVDLGIDSASRCAGTTVNYAAAPLRWSPTTCAVSATVTANTLPSNRGDGVPESFVHCGASSCTVAQLMDVVAAKIYVLARSREAATGLTDSKSYVLGSVAGSQVTIAPAGTDKYRRHLFQTTIRLQNISGRRESP